MLSISLVVFRTSARGLRCSVLSGFVAFSFIGCGRLVESSRTHVASLLLLLPYSKKVVLVNEVGFCVRWQIALSILDEREVTKRNGGYL